MDAVPLYAVQGLQVPLLDGVLSIAGALGTTIILLRWPVVISIPEEVFDGDRFQAAVAGTGV